MAAMRIMTKDEFYAELTKYGFVKSEAKTAENTLWLHEASGKSFSVPHHSEEIPECVLNQYLAAIGKLYHEPGEEKARVDKHYEVTEKKKPEPSLKVIK